MRERAERGEMLGGEVWKVVFVCCSRRAHLHIGLGLMGWCPGIYICVGSCGRVMLVIRGHIFISGREDECGCFLCADSSRVDGVSCC